MFKFATNTDSILRFVISLIRIDFEIDFKIYFMFHIETVAEGVLQ